MIERKMYSCEYCGKRFKSGDWMGCSDDKFKKHVVQPKTYHSLHDNNIITLTKEKLITSPVTGESMRVPGFAAQFSNGHFTTDDPQYQEILDDKASRGALVTLEEYTESKLDDKQKTARARTQLKEKSALLEKAQAELDELRRENERLAKTPRGVPFQKKDEGKEAPATA
jgi:hypothetical protein